MSSQLSLTGVPVPEGKAGGKTPFMMTVLVTDVVASLRNKMRRTVH